ncbi:MAG: glycine cleavage T C-terminal barrel domain-containing protein, partial [Pseudomonadota bacterium]
GLFDDVGLNALRSIKAAGVKRHQLGLILDHRIDGVDDLDWLPVEQDGRAIGHMTHRAWSYGLNRCIGYALVAVDAVPGDAVTVVANGARVPGELSRLPFEK